jgi:hypothetical protein
MLEASAARILAQMHDDDVVLDIGGALKPFARADWVMDILPFRQTGQTAPRVTPDTWIQRDICDHEPYPFGDDQVDFVICSHTLEDVRDPIWVCSEMARIAKRGYIECPSRLEEQSYGFQGPWTGWSHHRWLVEVEGSRIEFAHKVHTVNGRDSDRFPPGFRDALSPEERVQALFWEGSLDYGERIFSGPLDVDAYTSGFVSEQMEARGWSRSPLRAAIRRLRA